MKRVLALVVLVAWVLTTGVAHAEDRAAAERYFRAGAKAYAAQNFAAAAANFDEAFRAQPMPEIAFSGAQAYRRLFRVDARPAYVRRAVELYRAYLAQVKTGGRVGDAADNLAEMQRELDKLGAAGATAGPLIAHTRLGISVTLADQQAGDASTMREIGDATGEAATRGLHATIDGKPVDAFALVDVEPTEHVIGVVADGYFAVEKKTLAVSGQAQLIEVELEPKPASVAVTTEDDARISIDGRTIATAPTAALELPAGRHVLAVIHRGREPFARELTVARGEQLTVAALLAPTPRRKAVPWVLGGASVLAASAITTGVLAYVHDGRAASARDQIDSGNRPPADLETYDLEVSSRDRYVTATWVLGGAAIAASTVGTLLYLFDTPSREGLWITPTTTGGGISYSGRF
jgi:hypothetical protein